MFLGLQQRLFSFRDACLADSLSFQKQLFWKRLSPLIPQVPDATF